MSEQLVVRGMTDVDGMKFHAIEGGFGDGKKSMLAKDIAEIHGQSLGGLNRRINENIKRFTTNVDIIDLKRANASEALGYEELGYTKQAYNQSNNIYLLSERGYAKLLKILEDDLAWEQYDKLVDGYFNLRSVAKINNALKAAEIISKTTRNNLPYVLQALRQAGLNFETTTAGTSVVDDRLTSPTDDVVIRNNLNFKMDKNQWLYLTASDIAYALFGDRNKARTVGKILTDIYGYKPKNSGMLRHFRIVRGVKQYFVPLKI